MPRFAFDWDPEMPGSRFTFRPALVVLPGEIPEAEQSDAASAQVVRQLVGDWILEPDEDLGAPRAIGGGIGRGAEGWAAVLEWTASAVGTGIIGAASWEAIKAAANAAVRIISEIRRTARASTYISRGMAAYLAIAHVLDNEPRARLAVEAVEEPSAIGGVDSPEINYVGIGPWVVFLVDLDLQTRFIVAVSPEGEIRGVLRSPLERHETMYTRLQRPS